MWMQDEPKDFRLSGAASLTLGIGYLGLGEFLLVRFSVIAFVLLVVGAGIVAGATLLLARLDMGRRALVGVLATACVLQLLPVLYWVPAFIPLGEPPPPAGMGEGLGEFFLFLFTFGFVFPVTVAEFALARHLATAPVRTRRWEQIESGLPSLLDHGDDR